MDDMDDDEHGDLVLEDRWNHKKLGWLRIWIFEDGWTQIFHKSGKLLNEHYSVEDKDGI